MALKESLLNSYINPINSIISIFIVSLFLMPNITIASGIPAVRFEDLIFYVMLLTILIKSKNKFKLVSNLKYYLLVLILFICWINITMLLNGRITFKSDYFESYKMFKYIIILLFFYIFSKNNFMQRIDPIKIIHNVFFFVIIFNLFHYFNIFGFNSLIMPYYAPEHHLSTFGLNSLGEEATKRMLGTMGNPNNNAIIFGFFGAFFLAGIGSNKKSKRTNIILLLFSIIMFLMAQSRTVFIALFAMFFVYWFLSRISMKSLIYLFILSFSAMILVNSLHFEYISSLWTRDLATNNSLLVRFEIWDFLLDMINRSPLIGYGPNKDFFYQNNLFAENEYLLMTWRYGYIGLVFYLLWILMPVYTAIKSKSMVSSRIIILFSIIILVSALTNAPLSEPRIMSLYAVLSGVMYADYNQKKQYRG